MLKVYKFLKFYWVYSYISTMYVLLYNSLTWLFGINVIAFIFYVVTLKLTKEKRQVTLILLINYLMLPIDLISLYSIYKDWLLLFISSLGFVILFIYLHVLREQIEYL